jgi:hypothetical protein
MTPQTQCFEIGQVVETAQDFVRAASLFDVIDLESIGFAQTLVFRM